MNRSDCHILPRRTANTANSVGLVWPVTSRYQKYIETLNAVQHTGILP